MVPGAFLVCMVRLLRILFVSVALFIVAAAVARSVERDSVAVRVPYPERLIKEFPYIYSDTAYSTRDCHVVVRAVWMSRGDRDVRVSTPEMLPVPAACAMVRFVVWRGSGHEDATFQTEAIATQRK